MKVLVSMALIFLSSIVFAQNNPNKICGTYLVNEKGEISKVKISQNPDGSFEGKIIWMKEPNFKDGKPKTDVKNPDPAKRTTPADKIVLLHNFKYDSKNNEWKGQIYNPVEGKIYKSYAVFENDKKLKIRGYVGVPALGRSVYWDKID